MKKFSLLSKRFSLFAVIFLGFLSFAKVVFAQLENPLRHVRFEDLINAIIGFLWAMGIPLAVLIILIGAFYMMTSGGKPEKFEKGKKVIFYAFIGLIVILIAQGFVYYIIKRLFPPGS